MKELYVNIVILKDFSVNYIGNHRIEWYHYALLNTRSP